MGDDYGRKDHKSDMNAAAEWVSGIVARKEAGTPKAPHSGIAAVLFDAGIKKPDELAETTTMVLMQIEKMGVDAPKVEQERLVGILIGPVANKVEGVAAEVTQMAKNEVKMKNAFSITPKAGQDGLSLASIQPPKNGR